MRWCTSELVGDERDDVGGSASVDRAFGVVLFVVAAASAPLLTMVSKGDIGISGTGGKSVRVGDEGAAAA